MSRLPEVLSFHLYGSVALGGFHEGIFMISSWTLHGAGVVWHQGFHKEDIMVALMVGILAGSAVLVAMYSALVYTVLHASKK